LRDFGKFDATRAAFYAQKPQPVAFMVARCGRYATTLQADLYVSSAFMCCTFQKKSKSGIATPKMDVDLIVKRYKEARERAKNE
jgi:hypothetical protein